MKNFAKYICLFLVVFGINISVWGGNAPIENRLTGCTAAAGQQTTVPTDQQRRDYDVELFYTINPGKTGEGATVSVELVYPSTGESLSLNDYWGFGWNRVSGKTYRLRLYGSTIMGTTIGGFKDRTVRITINCPGGTPIYTLTYDANGGETTCTSGADYEVGTTFNLCTSEPIRTGYTFDGWKYNSTPYAAGASFTMPDDDATLVAQWTGAPYDILLNSNAVGVANGSAKAILEDTKVTDFARVYNPNATIIGYYTAARGGNKVLTAEGTLLANVPGYTSGGKWIKAENTTLYAQYLYANYQTYCPRTLTFDKNGQSTATPWPADQTGKSGFTPVRPGTDPVVTNLNFGGWYTTPECTGAEFNFASVTEDMTVYAKWTLNGTEITVFANNGTEPEDQTACTVIAGTSNPICYTPTKTGYEIVGYYTGRTTGGTKVYDAGGTMVLNNGAYTDESGWISTKTTLDLYAVWQPKTYNITIDANGGDENKATTVKYDGTSLATFTAPKRTGYTLEGYYTLAEGGDKVAEPGRGLVANVAGYTTAEGKWMLDATETVTLYAHWTAKERTITYYDGDAVYTGAWKSDPHPTTYLEGIGCTLVDAKKDCYTFNGWYRNSDLSGSKTTSIGTSITGNQTFYAKWTQITYTVSFDNLGHGSKPTNQTVNCGEKATDPNTADVTGYHLEGWYTDNGTWANKWDFETDVVTEATTLYAHWVSNDHTITCQTQIGVNGAVKTVCGEVAVVAAGTSNVEVTLNESCIPEGYHLYGWTVTTSKGGSTDNTPNVENKKITITKMPDADVTVTAILAPEATVTGTVALTSAVGVNAGTALNAITISASDITPVEKIRIKYRNNSNSEVYDGSSRGNSAFRLKDAIYNVADGGSGNIDVATVYGGSNTHSFTMVYSPKNPNTMDDYTMIVELLGNEAGSIVYDTKELPLSGRSLPNTFVVATKYNGMWYALPNDMGEAGTYAPVLINVDEENKVAYGPATAGYGLNTYLSTNNMPLNFVGASDKCLWASSASEGEGTNIRNYAVKSSAGSESYAWILTTSDMESYTMSPLNTERSLRYWNDKWGMFTSGNTDMHFYPLQEVTPMTVTPTTWGMGWVEVAASTNPGEVKLIIDGDNETVTATETAEVGIYRLTDSRIGVATNSCREMAILKGGQQAIVKMPMIVASDKAATVPSEVWTGVGLTVEGCKDCDIVVTNGATLSYTNSSSAVSMGKMAVYAGARLEDANDKMTWDALDIRREGDVVGSAKLNGANGTRPVNFTWTFDNARWYWFTLPMAAKGSQIKNLDGSASVMDDDWWLADYDGARRVTNGDGGNWHDIYADASAAKYEFVPGKGYIIALPDNKHSFNAGKTKKTLVFPMTGYTENATKNVTVYAYGANTDAAANRVGWNAVGDPFMEYYNTSANPFSALLVGEIAREDGKWTHTGSVPYVTIPVNGGEYYEQEMITEADLSPFTSFFVQVGGTSNGQELSLAFDNNNRGQRAAVAARAQQEESEPIIATLVLSNSNNQNDETGIVVWENFNDSYEVGGDLVKMKGDNYKNSERPTLYSLHESGELAFQATNEAGAARTTPLGYYTKLNGEHVFSLKENVDLSLFESIILVDNELGVRHNLLLGNYTFSAMAEENTTRFGVEVRLRHSQDIETDIPQTDTGSGRDIRKIIYNDKLFIVVDGKIYDGTGKLVNK